MSDLTDAMADELVEALATTDEYRELVATLPADAHDAFRDKVVELELCVQEPTIAGFLPRYLHCVHDLFAAEAVGLWIKNADQQAIRQSSIGWEQLKLDKELEQVNQRLVTKALELTSPQPVLMKPFSRVRQIGEANPTDSFLLFGPVHVDGDSVATVQIFLGPKPARATSGSIRGSYLVFLQRVVQVLCRRLEREAVARKTTAKQSWEAILESRDRLLFDLASMKESIRSSTEQWLHSLAGTNRGSLEANRELVTMIREVLDQHGLQVACPTCGAAATLRCQKAGNAKAGAFQFDHRVNGKRTFHGGTTSLPQLDLLS